MRFLFIFSLIISFSFGEFSKSKNIVVDTKTNYMWQDNIEVTLEESAILGEVYCEELVLNGYIDWKMPTLKELQTIIDQTGEDKHLSEVFEFFKDGDYFSRTTNVTNMKKQWYVNFKSGKVASKNKNLLGHVRCVRKIQ